MNKWTYVTLATTALTYLATQRRARGLDRQVQKVAQVMTVALIVGSMSGEVI